MPDTFLHEPIVKINGGELRDEHAALLERVVVDESVLLPSMCELTFRDAAADNVLITDGGFTLGAALKVDIRGEQGLDTLFDGEITALEASFDATGTHVIVRGYHKAHRLHRGRKTQTWTDSTDSDAVEAVLGAAGVSAEVSSTSVVHPYLAQAAQTDWEFVSERARMTGHELALVDGTLTFRKPKAPSSGAELSLREDLLSFRPRISAVNQPSSIETRGWDPDTKDAVVATATAATNTASVGLGNTDATGALGDATYTRATHPLAPQTDAAQDVADALAERLTSTVVEAEGSVLGRATLRAGSPIKISGAGDPFDGDYSLTQVRHVLDEQEAYVTYFSISGRQERSLLGLASVGATNGAGAAPSSRLDGPFPALVTNSKDPDNLGRVKVKVPWLADDIETDWARVVYPGGGIERGLALVPEVDDEVLVLFGGGDLARPFVLGGLYSTGDQPPSTELVSAADGKTTLRQLKTRKKHLLEFDDAEAGGGITIKTGNEQQQEKLVIDAVAHTITLESSGNITIEAKNAGTMTIKAGTTMSIEATTSLELKAPTIKLDGSAEVNVQSSGQLQLQGSTAKLTGTGMLDVVSTGITQVQGALVKIN
jgi:phage protein D/phage baseplate assembly protein gpV